MKIKDLPLKLREKLDSKLVGSRMYCSIDRSAVKELDKIFQDLGLEIKKPLRAKRGSEKGAKIQSIGV